jgi:hypothetical protein
MKVFLEDRCLDRAVFLLPFKRGIFKEILKYQTKFILINNVLLCVGERVGAAAAAPPIIPESRPPQHHLFLFFVEIFCM